MLSTAESHSSKGAPYFAVLNLPDAFTACPTFFGRHSEQFPPHFFPATLTSGISTVSFIYRLKSPTLHSLSKRMQQHSFDLECCFHNLPSSGILLHFLWSTEPKLCIQWYGLKGITCFLGFFIFFLIFLHSQFFWALLGIKLTHWTEWHSTEWYPDPAMSRGVAI